MALAANRTTSRSDVAALKDSAREDFKEILTRLEAALKTAPRLFPSGIELIELTLKAGSNIQFSVIIAGKDAPKIPEPVAPSGPPTR